MGQRRITITAHRRLALAGADSQGFAFFPAGTIHGSEDVFDCAKQRIRTNVSKVD
jgi:hypothetical protein